MKTYIIELARQHGFSPKPYKIITIKASSKANAVMISANHSVGYVFYSVRGIK